ncbi:MAG TPA: nitrogen regulation protein NR(I), partial [Gammaproteobacteria bacterium]|nr:nitrogen regulation protein NR(I) [Gammaproteobacteria bacterium]
MPSNNRVWVIDDDKSIRWVLEKALSQANFVVETFESGRWVLEQLEHIQPQAIITDVRMPGTDGFQLLDRIHQKYSNIPVIIMTAHSDLDSAVTAFQGGAFEYLPKPFDVDEAVEMVVRAVRHQHEELESVATDELSENEISREIVGEAPAMQEVFRAIGRLSRSNLSVLITGESGTGKELVARALHRHSPRAEYPFIALNTAAIPKELLESELFGHEK